MVRGGITTLPVIWRWRLAFAVLAAICAAWLLFGPKPWDIAREIDKVREAGKLLKTRHYVIPIFYWVAAGNFILSWLLLAGARWWSRPLPPSEASALPAAPRRWWMAVGLVILLGLALRVPLSTRSLWWDELWQTKFTATGYFLGKPEDPPASRHLAEGSWERAFWYYSRPTNHPVASVPARFCHLVWKALSHPSGPLEYNNLVLRLPTLLVCALTFLALALLGRALGLPWVGILAALLLALHPWHIRYGVDVRSYAYLMLSVTGGLLACARLSSGASSWRPWALLGVSQFAMVWSWFLAAAVAAPLALVSLGLVWLRWRGADRRVACGRWLLVHVLAGMAFLQIMGPNLVQTREYVSKKDLQQDGGQRISRARVLDLATVCLLGLPGDSATETFPGHAGFPPTVALTSFATEFRAKPLLMGTAALVIGLALLTGMVAAFRTRIGLAFGALLVAALLLAALFTILPPPGVSAPHCLGHPLVGAPAASPRGAGIGWSGDSGLLLPFQPDANPRIADPADGSTGCRDRGLAGSYWGSFWTASDPSGDSGGLWAWIGAGRSHHPRNASGFVQGRSGSAGSGSPAHRCPAAGGSGTPESQCGESAGRSVPFGGIREVPGTDRFQRHRT